MNGIGASSRFLGAVVWLAAGALAAAAEPQPNAAAVPTAESFDAFVSDSDREHWAFQPVRRPAVPAVSNPAWPLNPLDCFILAKLDAVGWTPNPPAQPSQLLRRIHLDLLGLPPTPAEQDRWLADPSLAAWERLVDELLAHPHYGERWARHWLDLARYAETNGYERDAVKPHVWRYRDYVIRALNADVPYDRFLVEQIAGDELADATGETLIATGFLRLGPWDDEPADPKEDRFDQLDDIVRTVGEVSLALTVGCGRCHNHKFEPISALDYYRLVAIFNPLQRPQAGRTDLDLPAGSRAELAAQQRRDEQLAAWQRDVDGRRRQAEIAFLKTGASALPANAVAAFLEEPGQRTDPQKQLVQKHAAALAAEVEKQLPAAERQEWERLARAMAELRQQQADLPRGYFFREAAGAAPATHVLLRGKATAPGPLAEPGVPKVLATAPLEFPPAAETSRRRLTFARWLTRPDHPLTARVIVNRVWQFHFGEGLVRTPSDFGIMGQAPTHPELLDWLADWFVQEGGWSLKRLHRLILTSATYRMSRQARDDYLAADPTNQRWWRVPYRRLEVEALCDSMLAVSGRLNDRMYGPSMYPHVPQQALEGHSDPKLIWRPFDEVDASRRTVYAHIKRSLVVPMLETLDLCDTTRSAASRNITSVAPQALTLLNGDFVNRQAVHLVDRLERETGADPRWQLVHAWRLALARTPSPDELERATEFLQQETAALKKEDFQRGEAAISHTAPRRALIQFCRALFNLNEFAYPD